jgi:hypothetical protein
MSYYNTTKIKGYELIAYKKRAESQESLVYNCFLDYKKPLSPSMILYKLGLNCPITSIRRAVTNLTLDNKLIKTNDTTRGIYGKPEHLWRLKTDADDLRGL